MKQPIASLWVAHFGPFEADLRAGQLCKNGRKVKLQDQPFQILVCLLEHAGEVVTREELRQNLWPADTFTDFDHGLNNAINRLREALCDSADRPRYIETLPRRGYRFIAAVDIVSEPAPSGIPPNGRLPNGGTMAPQEHLQGMPQQVQGDHGTPFGAATSLVSAKREPQLRRTWGARLAAMLAMLFVGLAMGWFAWHQTSRLRGQASSGSGEPAPAVMPLTSDPGDEIQPSLSPDGNQVAYAFNEGGVGEDVGTITFM